MINITNALTELCPFCGQNHQIELGFDMHFGNNWSICCSNRVLLTAYTERELQEMIDFWNNRPGENIMNKMFTI